MPWSTYFLNRSQTILVSHVHTHRWAYLDCPSLDRSSFYFNVFKAGRSHHIASHHITSHHIASHRYASKVRKRSQKFLLQNFHSSIAPSFRAVGPALNSADVAADLHSVNSSFIPLKSRVLGSDYAGSQTPSASPDRFINESFGWVGSFQWIVCT